MSPLFLCESGNETWHKGVFDYWFFPSFSSCTEMISLIKYYYLLLLLFANQQSLSSRSSTRCFIEESTCFLKLNLIKYLWHLWPTWGWGVWGPAAAVWTRGWSGSRCGSSWPAPGTRSHKPPGGTLPAGSWTSLMAKASKTFMTMSWKRLIINHC